MTWDCVDWRTYTTALRLRTVAGSSSELVIFKLLDFEAGRLHQDLSQLQRPLKQLGRAAPYLIEALTFLLSPPFSIDSVPKIVRGDYINVSGALDLTLSTIDNAIFTGTGFSGALRALEQSWGRDPATMIPDIRFSPNPADAPVERGE